MHQLEAVTSRSVQMLHGAQKNQYIVPRLWLGWCRVDDVSRFCANVSGDLTLRDRNHGALPPNLLIQFYRSFAFSFQ
jgi:hypothetical protein